MNSDLSSVSATVSVALTTCNGERYLAEQLESIQHQTHQPHELIVGDDASTDETVVLLEQFAQHASFPVRILKNETRLGVFNNFLHVFNQCQGQYIAYCDQDDVWHPRKLEKCCDMLGRQDVVLVSHRSEVVDSHLRSTGQLIPYGFPLGSYPPPHFPGSYWSHGHQMVFRRELVAVMNYLCQTKRDNLEPCQNNLDLLINVTAGMNGVSVFIPEALIKFRRHGQTVSCCAKENERDDSPNGYHVRKMNNISGMCDILGGVDEYLGSIDMNEKLWFGSINKQCYLKFLHDRKLASRARLQIYAEVGFVDRIVGLLSAIIHRAYARPQTGGVGGRQVAIDILALFRLLSS